MKRITKHPVHLLSAAIMLFTFAACSPAPEDQELIDTARRGTISELKDCLSKGADVNARSVGGISGSTALSEAAARGSAKMVRALIDAGADVNLADDMGYTPLFRAGTEEVVRLLLANGADLSAQWEEGETVLEWAEKKGFEWKAKILREHLAEQSSAPKLVR